MMAILNEMLFVTILFLLTLTSIAGRYDMEHKLNWNSDNIQSRILITNSTVCAGYKTYLTNINGSRNACHKCNNVDGCAWCDSTSTCMSSFDVSTNCIEWTCTTSSSGVTSCSNQPGTYYDSESECPSTIFSILAAIISGVFLGLCLISIGAASYFIWRNNRQKNMTIVPSAYIPQVQMAAYPPNSQPAPMNPQYSAPIPVYPYNASPQQLQQPQFQQHQLQQPWYATGFAGGAPPAHPTKAYDYEPGNGVQPCDAYYPTESVAANSTIVVRNGYGHG